MMRRRLKWIGPLAILAIVAAVLIWLRRGPTGYEFLRRFGPVESYEEEARPSERVAIGERTFRFKADPEEVRKAISNHWPQFGSPNRNFWWFDAPTEDQPGGARLEVLAEDGYTCTLTISESRNLSWLEIKMAEIMGSLHLR